MKEIQIIKNEDGSVLIIALIMLVLLTILGMTATSTSNIELQIAGNERNYKRAFFTANSGVEYVRSELNDGLVDNNEENIATGSTLKWTFAIKAAIDTDGDGKVDPLILHDDISFTPLDGYTYSVKIWDNDDGDGDLTSDSDGIIYVLSEATGPGNVDVKVKVQLQADLDGDAINSYTAQQGGESGKGYSSQDLNPIGDFTTQI